MIAIVPLLLTMILVVVVLVQWAGARKAVLATPITPMMWIAALLVASPGVYYGLKVLARLLLALLFRRFK